jgi:hypothetical protein
MNPSFARLLPPRRGAVAQPVSMELVRELTEEDLAQLSNALPIAANPIKRAREIHHRQAQLVAEGRKDVEIAAIVGCTPQRIYDLKKDPTFQYLVAYYSSQASEIEYETHRRVQGKLVDVLELAVDEIQTRLEDNTSRAETPLSELRKVAEFAADRTIAPPRATQVGSALPPTRIELNFGWKQPEPTTVDVTPEKENSNG